MTADHHDDTDSIFADAGLPPPQLAAAGDDAAKRIAPDAVVRKCATTIHVSCGMTLRQRRAFNVFLHYALPHLPHRQTHRVSLSALAWAMTGDSKFSRNLRALVADLKGMMRMVAEWDVLGLDGNLVGWEGMMLISWISIDRDTDSVYFRFTPEFQERVFQARRAADILLCTSLAFRSLHAMVLYEHVRYYLDERVTPWLPLAAFRAFMGLADKASYHDFHRLMQHVIAPAITEVNATSDIAISARVKRKDRGKVTAIQFAVTLKPNGAGSGGRARNDPPAARPVSAPAVLNTSCFTAGVPLASAVPAHSGENVMAQLRMAEYGVPTKRASALLRAHGAVTIITALSAADAWRDRLAAQGESVRNPTAIADKAIREQWVVAPPEPIPVIPSTGVERPLAAPPAPTRPTPPGSWYTNYLEQVPVEDQQSLLNEFAEFLADPQRSIIRDAYHKHQMNSRIVLAEFQGFLNGRRIAALAV